MGKQCVVRSFSRGYPNATETLSKRFEAGWTVVHITPFIKDGNTEYVEYILEKFETEEHGGD